ncbi:hypothetical protein SCLARK_00908 [Spiroplasma clarkii]|nr:hypothetical protein [Spiroplasma clarkii]ARU91517.1 hypothetical protein SCLARK_00908 [Spiroplasma clarkii]
MAYDIVVENSLKASFAADALSTLDFKSDDKDGTLKSQYEAFADQWWDKYWKEKTDKKEDTDLNAIGKNMIEFDKAVADKFHSYGYVHTGWGWLFSKGSLSDTFSSDFQAFAGAQQSIWDQADYEATLSWQPTGLSKFKVTGANGGNIVNNKVWLLNQQIDGLKLLVSLGNLDLGGILGKSASPRLDLNLGVLKNKDLTEKDIAAKITVADLYHPDFTTAIGTQRAAIVMMFMSIVILPASVGLGVLAIIEFKKGA